MYIHPVGLSVVVHIFYLCSYTAWDKTNKQLQLSNFLDVVLFRQGLIHTLNELNKILSLTGLTILPLAYFLDNGYDHLWLSLWLQVIHAVYSSWKYYGTKVPYISEFPAIVTDLKAATPKQRLVGIKKASILSASISLAFLASHFYIPNWDAAVVGIVVLLTGLIHFYTMEIDYKLILRVRTTGNFCLAYAIVATVGLAIWGTTI